MTAARDHQHVLHMYVVSCSMGWLAAYDWEADGYWNEVVIYRDA